MTVRGWQRAAAAAVTMTGIVAAQPPPPKTNPAPSETISQARTHLDSYWQQQIGGYKPAAVLAPYVPGPTTPCRVTSAANAFYCSETHGIYYGEAFFESLREKAGNYSPVLVLAHEWGHLVQRVLGLDTAKGGLWPVQEELQADCLAGAFTRHAVQNKLFSGTPVDDAVRSLFRIGDRAPWFDPDAHGTPGQRIDAFSEGLEGRPCLADEFFVAIRMDLSSTTQPPTPARGTLQELARELAGRFRRENIKHSPALINIGAVELLESRYRASDGVVVTITLAAFGSENESRAYFAERERRAIGSSLKEVRRTRVVSPAGADLGTAIVFQGQVEVVLWRNLHVVGIAEGTRDYAWELATLIL